MSAAHSQTANKPVCHCWEDGPLTADGMSTTCFLLDGHEGQHEFVRDDEITIKFNEQTPCGGPDRVCLVAEARGEHNRCQGKCAYDD